MSLGLVAQGLRLNICRNKFYYREVRSGVPFAIYYACYLPTNSPEPPWGCIYDSTSTYAGISGASFLQNAHLSPRPPSHVSAGTTAIAFASPGSLNCVTFVPHGVVNSYGSPPVWFKFTCCGLSGSHKGHLDAPLDAAGSSDAAPLATSFDIVGSPPMIKLPRMPIKS